MTQRLRIQGRGPVAIALRLFLARQGFASAAISHEAFLEQVPAAVAARVLALSLGSTHLLSRIVALPDAAPIRTVDVSIAHRAGRTRFHAADLDSPTLGCVIRYSTLHRALFEALQRIDDTTALTSPSPFTLPPSPHDDEVVVVADGEPRSPSILDFQQAALLAEVVVERDVPDTAFEHFTTEGPLALLPLPGTRRRAVVWCAAPQQTARRAQLPPHAFEAELQAAFGSALGAMRLASERHQAPLRRRREQRDEDPRRVAIGNAAQALHPVAGQGLNLGLRDAFELAQELGDAHARGAPLEDALARFRRRRIADRAATVGVTDALAQLFTWPALGPVQSIAFDVLDWTAPLRDRFAKALMFGLRSGRVNLRIVAPGLFR